MLGQTHSPFLNHPQPCSPKPNSQDFHLMPGHHCPWPLPCKIWCGGGWAEVSQDTALRTLFPTSQPTVLFKGGPMSQPSANQESPARQKDKQMKDLSDPKAGLP